MCHQTDAMLEVRSYIHSLFLVHAPVDNLNFEQKTNATNLPYIYEQAGRISKSCYTYKPRTKNNTSATHLLVSRIKSCIYQHNSTLSYNSNETD